MKKNKLIQNTLPYFPIETIKDVLGDIKQLLENGQFILGEKTECFEHSFSKYIGTKYAIAVNSATTALQICLSYYNVKNREVILPTNTFLATPNAVLYAGGKPVFTDINKENLCVDFQGIKKQINSLTKGVIIVHINGIISPEINRIREICKENNLFLIEDCAHAHGSEINGVKAGNFSDAGCFSFYPTKVITTGTGGMITTNDRNLKEFAFSLRHHGQGKNLNDIINFGNDWVMTEINALLGIYQLKNIDSSLKKRNSIADRYTEALFNFPQIRIIEKPANQICAYYKYQIILDKFFDAKIFKNNFLKKYGIKLGAVYWPPCHLQPIYQKEFNYELGDYPIAEKVLSRAITLPLHQHLEDADIDYIIDCVVSEISKY